MQESRINPSDIDNYSAPRRLPLFGLELLAICVIFWADSAGYIPLSKTPFLIIVAWISIRIRGKRWKDLGLSLAPGFWRLAIIGAAAGVAFWAFEYFIENPVLHLITGVYPDLSDFKDVVGNIQLLLVILAANIVLAGVGEELVWRGYVLGRVAEALGTRWNWIIALVTVNVVFGLAHSYQGEAGMTQAAVQGFLLGLLYLKTGKNLMAPIVAHTIANTCDFLLLFSGHHVGVTGQFPF